MFLTEKEIFSQDAALQKTYDYFLDKEESINHFFAAANYDSVTYVGSGSSYSLCQSAEMMTKITLGVPANSLTAGDLLLNFSQYSNLIRNTLLIAPSRSGSTSEVVMAVSRAREEFDVPCISICAKENSTLAEIVDLSLEIPWAFDESVCQTRTVSNLYLANLILTAIMAGKQSLIDEVRSAVHHEKEYMALYKDPLKSVVSDVSWNKVVVLADAELQGIGSEGALAFKEICRIPSNYYHVLDVRHGPMVLIDDQTLVIMALSPHNSSYQQDLINDLHKKGAYVITVGSHGEDLSSDFQIAISDYHNYGVNGIPFIFVPQALAYFKAVREGINPDAPDGLEPWIKL